MTYGIWRKSLQQDKGIPSDFINGWYYRWAHYGDDQTPTTFVDVNAAYRQAEKSNKYWNEASFFFEVKEYP